LLVAKATSAVKASNSVSERMLHAPPPPPPLLCIQNSRCVSTDLCRPIYDLEFKLIEYCASAGASSADYAWLCTMTGSELDAMCSDLSPPLPAASYPPNSERSLYLTFNDGPSVGTREVLEVLRMFQSRKDAVDDPLRATFFLLGNNFDTPERGQAIVAENLQIMQDILSARHSLGLRSYSGDCAEFVDYETAQKNVDQGRSVLRSELFCDKDNKFTSTSFCSSDEVQYCFL
jgi:hypothetical protein